MKVYRTLRLLVVAGLLLAACGGTAPAATPTVSNPPAADSNAPVIAEGRLYPRAYADVAFNSSGKVAEVLVSEGDTVQAGQVLARMVNSQAAESTLASAQKDAEVAAAQQAVATAQQAVATAQQAQLDAQQEGVNAHKAITDMLASTAIAVNLAQAQLIIDDLQKQIDDASRNLGYLISPDLKYYQDQVTQAQNALTNAQQNVTLVDISQLQVDLRNAQKQLETATNVYNNAKDAFAKCPACLTVFAYDRMTTWPDAVNLYTDATNQVQQIQMQIDQTQRGTSLSVTTAQDNLDTAQKHLNYFLQGPDAIKVNQARSNIALMQAQLAKARSDAEKLTANHGLDPDKLKAAQDRVATAEASLISVQTSVTAAQTAVTTAQANLVAAQLKQNSVELKAPFAGTVATQNLKAGEYINLGQAVITLADLSQWEVKTNDLTERDVVKIKPGQAVTVKLDALPGVQLTGVVKAISVNYGEKQGDIVYTVTITLTSGDPQMRWGMTANVTFEK